MSQEEKIDDRSLERKRPPDDGSPITVGGGGGRKDIDRDRENVSCRFKDDVYEQEERPENEKKKFKLKGGGKIKTLMIRRGGKWRDYSKDLPPNGDCRIEITCEGQKDDVTIYGPEFGIEMNPGTYVKVASGKHQNPNAASYINNVVLNDGQLHNLGPFNEDDDCKVCLDYVGPDKSTCPRDPVIPPGLES